MAFTSPPARAAAAGTAPSPEESLAELTELVRGAGGVVVGSLLQRRPRPDAATLLGGGKVEELAAAAADADVIVVDSELTPTQQRNLERATSQRVISRTQLILDIFARHARTREGQLQVELAQLDYLLPRLTGKGVAMSRLGGGIGTKGPGETKLETDRRRIHARIRALRSALDQVRKTRQQQRSQRESVPLATIALVGYTNAGKSALFNRLTGAEVLTSARMFATLDPTVRALRLPSGRKVLLSDTVGFLRDLPHGLINAFRATLEEVTRASLLVLVSDIHAPHRAMQAAEVQKVLHELNVTATPQIEVWNKSDLATAAELERIAIQAEAALPVSAHTGAGIAALLAALEAALPAEPMEEMKLRFTQPAGDLLSVLHQHGEVLTERYSGNKIAVLARLPAALAAKFQPFREG